MAADRLKLPFLIRLCYAVSIFAGMVQSAFQFGKLGGTSGQSGNLVKFGQDFAKGVATQDSHGEHMTSAINTLNIFFHYLLGNFIGGVWTNHDARKTLYTAGCGLVTAGGTIIFAAYLLSLESPLRRESQQLGSFGMGLQNGILVATTGYANTVTTSGSITDIGLLIGGATMQAGRKVDAFWKGTTLSLLVLCFMSGSLIGGILFFIIKAQQGEKQSVAVTMFVPGFGIVLGGLIAMVRGNIALQMAEQASDHQAPLVAQAAAPPPAPEPPPPPKPAAAPKPQPFVIGSYIACFCAGMVDDGSTRMLPDSPAPTHVTGPSVKMAMGGSALIMGGPVKDQELFLTNFKLVFGFFIGGILAGVVMSDSKRKTRLTGGIGVLGIGAVLAVGVGLNVMVKSSFTGELQHVCGLCMGFMNGLLCAISGFSRTTHMTGPLANVGICLGQASNPSKVTSALVFKLRTNAILVLCFILGIVVEDVIILVSPGNARWVMIPAVLLAFLGLGQVALHYRLRVKIASETNLQGQQLDRTVHNEETKSFKQLRKLNTAGGFVDSIVSLKYDSVSGDHFSFYVGADEDDDDDEDEEEQDSASRELESGDNRSRATIELS